MDALTSVAAPIHCGGGSSQGGRLSGCYFLARSEVDIGVSRCCGAMVATAAPPMRLQVVLQHINELGGGAGWLPDAAMQPGQGGGGGGWLREWLVQKGMGHIIVALALNKLTMPVRWALMPLVTPVAAKAIRARFPHF